MTISINYLFIKTFETFEKFFVKFLKKQYHVNETTNNFDKMAEHFRVRRKKEKLEKTKNELIMQYFSVVYPQCLQEAKEYVEREMTNAEDNKSRTNDNSSLCSCIDQFMSSCEPYGDLCTSSNESVLKMSSCQVYDDLSTSFGESVSPSEQCFSPCVDVLQSTDLDLLETSELPELNSFEIDTLFSDLNDLF